MKLLQKPIRNARFSLCSDFDFHVLCARLRDGNSPLF